MPDYNEVLNRPFTASEIKKVILSLKNSKASSPYDNILNEYIKCSKDACLQLYCKLFNVILTSGIVPDTWCTGVVVPIFKNKGDPSNPDNYRGITILSCLGKLFTSVLNARINIFLEETGLLAEEQAGFRKNYSTVDHIFSLKMLIDLYLSKKKRLFCSFIDYRKAFDSINRSALWKKMLDHSIDGKVLRVIHNIYEKAKSCIKLNNSLSDTFVSNLGVRQGENLSPILFSIFLNDLTAHMSDNSPSLECLSSQINEQLSENDVGIFLKLNLLLYADDTVILAETHEGLQQALDGMSDYCRLWKLSVNTEKTKVVVFSRGKLRNKPVFHFNNSPLEAVDDFSYLGVKFNYNGKFGKTKKHLTDQARKAMFKVMTNIRKLCLPVDIQLQMFDSMLSPILLYGVEVWGCENIAVISQFQLKFYKYILNLKMSTPNSMVLGELGASPIENSIKARILNFWGRLVHGKPNKICSVLYRTMFNLHEKGIIHCQWIAKVKTILNDLGCTNYWLSQSIPNLDTFKSRIKTLLNDQCLQNWNSSVNVSPKLLNYRIFKTELKLEKYLTCLPKNLSLELCKFRCLNSKIPIEKGRFLGIEREQRLCTFCDKHELGDEFHYLFNCSFLSNERRKYLPFDMYQTPNIIKFKNLMNSTDVHTLTKLALFVKSIMQKIK